MATITNLYIDQGTDFAITLDLRNESGGDYAILDHDFFCSISKLYSSTSKINVQLDTRIDSDGNDVLDFYISPTQTQILKPGKYVYDILMKSPSGNISKIMEGIIFILPSITIIEE